MQVFRTVLFGLFLMIATAATAMAEEMEDPYTPQYRVLRNEGLNRQTSTSLCINNPVTAECAIETYDACRAWDEKEVCDIARFDPGRYGYKHSMDYQAALFPYMYLSKRVLKASDIPAKYRDNWKEGDTLIYKIGQICETADQCYKKFRSQGLESVKKHCPPVYCQHYSPKTYANNRHAPDMYIVRQEKPDFWYVVKSIDSFDFSWRKPEDGLDKLLEEGLAQSPW